MNEVLAGIFTELPDKLLSQCGIAFGLMAAGIIYLSVQLNKKNAWIEKYVENTNEGLQKLTDSNEKLRELILMSKSSYQDHRD